MDEWLERVIDERNQLHIKVEKLEGYICAGIHFEVSKEERDRLYLQLDHMKSYESILIGRIGANIK